MKLPDLGIHTGMSYEQYAADPGIRATQLKYFMRTDAHAKHARDHPKFGAAMDLGIATHTYVLEPDRFYVENLVAPKIDKRSNDGKAEWAEWLENARGKNLLSAQEFIDCEGMGKAVLAHPDARAILRESKGVSEVTIFWELEGRRCKARIDRLCSWNGIPTAADLKSTRDGSLWGFDRSIRDFGYHLQGAWYLMGLKALSPAARQFVLLPVENKAPYVPAVYTMDDEYISIGSKLAMSAFHRLIAAEKTQVWKGYDTQTIYPPEFLVKQTMELEEGAF